MALTLRIKGDSAELDYTGSDPQPGSSLNVPTGGRERHPLVMVGLTYVMFTLDPPLSLNAGTLRPARAILPQGSMVNSAPGAALGMRSLTCAMTQIVTVGAFAQALPDLNPTAAPGGNAIMNIKTSARNGRQVMASIGPVGDGGGAAPFADGSDGAGGATGLWRNTPVEITETEVPIRFLRYGLQPDTRAPGLWRGGLSAVMEFQVFSPETVVTARTPEHYDLLTVFLARQPVGWRFFLNTGSLTKWQSGCLAMCSRIWRRFLTSFPRNSRSDLAGPCRIWPPAPMNARQIELFRAILRDGSLIAAAGSLGVSQPVASKCYGTLRISWAMPCLNASAGG